MNKQRVFKNLYREGLKAFEITELDKTLQITIMYEEYLKKNTHFKEKTIRQRINAILEFDVIRVLLQIEWININDDDLKIYMLMLKRLNYSPKEISKRFIYVAHFVAFNTVINDKFNKTTKEIEEMLKTKR